ncbi:isoleucine--tRNA ligase [Candidatus Riesia sp. GBBU]|nr:isoleucine--tRNA ligase [Candidatus Riesia sp. GBBU]ARC55110.1 isoleucine--tRNA ligase [Candidatus Riesia sp. GBBU]
MKNYKNTLNLPKTDFSMHGNLSDKEPDILSRWINKNLYKIIRKKKSGNKLFILHDGPPYANGEIHIGHAINKILKDFIIKSKGLNGFDSPYIPGWDCYGLPIEHKMEKIFGVPGKDVSTIKFRKMCEKYVNKQVEIQKKDFIRMGIFADWEHPYLTMNNEVESDVIRVLGKIIKNGYFIHDVKPVYWCVDCKSSLAEAEVEYTNIVSTSIDVKFSSVNHEKIFNIFGIRSKYSHVYMVIWTTTPWTIPMNRAIAVNPKFTYQLIKVNNSQFLILEKSLAKSSLIRMKFSQFKVISECYGYKLEFLKFYHPFMNLSVPVILSEHVTKDTGTGIVHIAPDHGIEDFLISKKYKIDVVNSVNEDGRYKFNVIDELKNVSVLKSSKLIINLMNRRKAVLSINKISHSCPFCWRHKKQLIFRSTSQWFISMNRKNLRSTVINEIDKVSWIPKYGKNKIRSMIINRPDWCISRQRSWGIPIPIFFHKRTKKLHPKTLEIIEKIAKLSEKFGSKIWWKLDKFELIGHDIKYYKKSSDILDVWFDSGSSHYSLLRRNNKLSKHNIDMYLEGSDQHRGWFMSSIVISVAINGVAPYKEVLTHGFVLNKKEEKMSKSKKNFITPAEIFEKFGADILRIWVSSIDYKNEIVFSKESLEYPIECYRKIRNTVRFLLSNLYDFDPNYHLIKRNNMVEIDKWIIAETKIFQKKIIYFYEKYNFYKVLQCLVHFCSIKLGSLYLDIIKNRQYTLNSNNIARRSCQTAMFHILESLVRCISPILSFTSDEIWRKLPGERNEFVFTEEYYKKLFSLDEKDKFNKKFWNLLLEIKIEVNKSLEKAKTKKIINSTLEATVILFLNKKIRLLIETVIKEIHFFFLTSKVLLFDIDLSSSDLESSRISGIKIFIKKTEGKKCPRCWQYLENLIKSKNTEGYICDRCIENTEKNGETRRFF